ncbi:hypothetical protein [Winogradskyella vincentii]|uniref:SdiA-regulated n=1 Tax=Winogradskyella vincentii TaxID=2877122 RepID=A0ABS7XWK0_9FLAO|nr:hypothetical protein [Winogradskyella vincentii]MCA0152035.1 hypothetical protein [Winogradskyella vincentii]
MLIPKRLIFILLITIACTSFGKLELLGDLPNSFKEASASEIIPNSNLIWVIEDSGNENVLYGLETTGEISKHITLNEATNIDWEDITADEYGNIYIGDFGNNNKNRTSFQIYKVYNKELENSTAKAHTIQFTLPADIEPKDFEAFFVHKDIFYLFSKEHKIFNVFTVPNAVGTHTATYISSFELEGKDTRVTSADISFDGKSVVLLNHKRLWKYTNYEGSDFFSGSKEKLTFKHNSQKEGICFQNDSTLIITDERHGTEGGNIYRFNLLKQ